MKTCHRPCVALSITIGYTLSAILLLAAVAFAAGDKTEYKFDFASGQAAPGRIQFSPTTVYNNDLGYGFDLGSNVIAVDRPGKNGLRGGFFTSDKPFYFSVALPEGNYNVTVILGDQTEATNTTIKAESRRLMAGEGDHQAR